jgi:hypothetical protein
MKTVTEEQSVRSRKTSVSNKMPLSGMFRAKTSEVVKVTERRAVPPVPPFFKTIAGLPDPDV